MELGNTPDADDEGCAPSRYSTGAVWRAQCVPCGLIPLLQTRGRMSERGDLFREAMMRLKREHVCYLTFVMQRHAEAWQCWAPRC